jgi:hypothetical protein
MQLAERPDKLAAGLKKTLSGWRRSTKFYGFREASEFGRMLEGWLHQVARELLPKDPPAALSLVEAKPRQRDSKRACEASLAAIYFAGRGWRQRLIQLRDCGKPMRVATSRALRRSHRSWSRHPGGPFPPQMELSPASANRRPWR